MAVPIEVPRLSMVELAGFLGCSTHWIARRIAEGMPQEADGCFKLPAVELWLDELAHRRVSEALDALCPEAA
jgi:hypothetical protein